jgi:dTDP-4-dehydrorhamnose 3,5-epimerase
LTLRDETTVVYKVDRAYAPESEGGIFYDDDTLRVPWPKASYIVSERDRGLPLFKDFVSPFE